MPTEAVIRSRLVCLAHRRAELDRERALVVDELSVAVRRGRAAGLQVKEMAGLAGVTRQTVYDLLGRE